MLLSLCCVAALTRSTASAQYPFQPFGVDAENLDVTVCNHNVGCPLIDQAAAAGAQWMRLFSIWWFIEPQQNVYSWGEYPWQVSYANQKGIQVYFTATWAPQWANGATSTTPPYAGVNCGDCGRTVLSSSYTYGFFYNLAEQFNGSTTAGCAMGAGYNPATCRPLVQYFGVWNEPNLMNNYNDTYFDPYNLGNYLNDFVNQYMSPAYNAVKAANPSASVVAPELTTGGGNTCGGWSNCGTWQNSWMQPLNQYFNSVYDIISIHGYHSSNKGNVDQVYNSFDTFHKWIWVTENSTSGVDALTTYYVDEYNRQSYWTKAFWELGGYGVPCSTAQQLLCSDSYPNLQRTAYFNAYYNVYFPH